MADRTTGDFGRKLREARERKGVSLRQIAGATKISIAVLESLEKNDISRLPGGIFSRAFVRSYAIEVGLDPENTIQDFIAAFPNESVTAGHTASVPIEDNEAIESDRRMASTFLWLVLISVPVAGGLLYFSTTGRSRPPLATQAPAAAVDTAAPAREPIESPKSDPPPSPAPPVAAAVDTPSPPSAPAGSTGVAATAPAAAATPTPATPTPATGGSETPTSDRLTVAISVRRPVWISATVDGQSAIERLLQAGEQRTIDVQRELVMTAGDAAAIVMTLNGASARPLGRTGQVVTVRVNPSNFRDYLPR